MFEADPKAGGFMRTQVPRFRLPEEVIDEETGYILDLGVEFVGGQRIDSMKALLARGLRRGVRRLRRAARARPRPARPQRGARRNIHIGIDWLASVYFGHVTKVGKRVIVLGGGNTAMDCCRSARRLGGDDVKVHRALGLRGDEGLAVGEGGRACTKASRSSTTSCRRPSSTTTASSPA